jgi:hypothetical protein
MGLEELLMTDVGAGDGMATNDKLAVAAHYVIARLPPDRLGVVKLNKILWFADCRHFSRHGKTITGRDSYVRKDEGPCAVGLEAALSALRTDGDIVERRVPAINFTRRELYAQSEPDLSSFTAQEIDTLLSVALEIAPLTASEASELSHDGLWSETLPGGAMAVSAGAVRVEPLDEADLDWARAAFR